MRSEPRCARTTVWPLSISLAATLDLSDGKRHFAYDVPGKSVTSYRWAKSE